MPHLQQLLKQQNIFHYAILLFFIAAILLLSLNGYFIISTNDDLALISLLRENEAHTLILHYGTSWILGQLYQIFPTGQWYSITILALYLVLLISLFYTLKKYGILLFCAFSFFILYGLFAHSISFMTVAFVIAAILVLQDSYKTFIFYLSIAALLRADFIVVLSPFIAIGFFLFTIKLKKFNYLMLSIPLIIIATHLYLKQEPPYKEWYTYNKARATIQDLSCIQQDTTLTKKEQLSLFFWFDADPFLFSNQKVIEAACTRQIVYFNNLTNLTLDKIKSIFKNRDFKYYLFVNLFIIYLLFVKTHSKRNLALNSLMFITIILILINRDVPRVSAPLILGHTLILLFQLHFFKENHKQLPHNFNLTYYNCTAKTFCKNSVVSKWFFRTKSFLKTKSIELLHIIFILGIFLMLFKPLMILNITKDSTLQRQKSLQNEIEILHARFQGYKLKGVTFPGTLLQITELNKGMLLHEDYLLDTKHNNIVLAGWLARHPINLKKYDYAKLLKHESYFLIASPTSLGPEFVNRILELYDQAYCDNTCKHELMLVAQTPTFQLISLKKVENTKK